MHSEGVIKFRSEHVGATLNEGQFGGVAKELAAWRDLFQKIGVLGQEPGRYEGAGFGNLSGRLNPPSLPKGRRRFLITGSQTSGMQDLSLAQLCAVESYSLRENCVVSRGMVPPSSESLTHGAIYDLSPAIRYVFHLHAPSIWQAAARTRMPTTSPDVGYGTQEMAFEMQRLYASTSLSERRVLAMAGHEDGVIAFGRNADEAGLALMREMAQAQRVLPDMV
jgi:ribulose-5-phosphate 4-epimerase/fuculose-1-phosphate aldolase